MVTVAEITQEDLQYLTEQFSKITSNKNYELPSAFAERVRYLDKELTPFPGRFSYDFFPYFRKIVDCFSPENPVRKVYLCKGNQLGGTTAVLETVMLYFMMACPTSQLYVNADETMAKTAVATKIERMIDNAGARHLIYSQNKKSSGARSTGDTLLRKEYPGGFLHCVGGRSANRFRSMSYQVALVDELDAMPDSLQKEGSVTDLILSRTDAFANKRKLFFASTPLIEQTSKIWKLYLQGDQQRYYVPCKHCGFMQPLEWAVWDESHSHQIGGIVWELRPGTFDPDISSVGYKCPHCGKIMKNYDKSMIMQSGEWRPTSEAVEPGVESYHISPLYNPPGMWSWEDAVIQWSKCWDLKLNRLRDKELYRTFRNLKQGLPFKESGESIRYEKAMLHRVYGFVRGTVPNDIAVRDTGSPVLIAFASVDVQKYNLFVDVKGYCAGGAHYTLDFFSIEGDVEDFNGPWDKLNDYLVQKVFIGTDKKEYRVAMTLVDSGHFTNWVYAFCARFSNGVYACKGADFLKDGAIYKVFDKSTLERIGLPLAYHVNTTALKDRISRFLNNMQWDSGQKQPEWYPNFPDDFRDDYFRMFEAENKVDEYEKKTNKFLRTYWKAKPGFPNHAFDTYVYNLAALEIFADDICRYELGVGRLDWPSFWMYARQGIFYSDPPRGSR